MKIKKFFAMILAFVSNLWKKVDYFVESITPVAINVVEQIKNINESTAGDIIDLILSKAIPGGVDDAMIDYVRFKLKSVLPKILTQLNIANAVSNIDDPNEQLKAIINAINMSPDELKNTYYHTLSVMILNSLADGRLTWSESVHLAEYYYSNIHKK